MLPERGKDVLDRRDRLIADLHDDVAGLEVLEVAEADAAAAVKPVDINDVINTSMDLLQRSIPKTIEIVTQLSEGLPQVLAGLAATFVFGLILVFLLLAVRSFVNARLLPGPVQKP